MLILLIYICCCFFCEGRSEELSCSRTPFGITPEGGEVYAYCLKSKSMEVTIINYGASVQRIRVDDRYGKRRDVVLGHRSLDGYLSKKGYFGCVVGRYANRIEGGSFVLNGKNYQLSKNNSGNTLHGGNQGLSHKLWRGTMFETKDSIGVILEFTSPHLDEGFPGELKCQVVYSLKKKNCLSIAYHVTSDRPTVVNLTNHTYFNLYDGGRTNIWQHKLKIFASKYTPVDENMIPTGHIKSIYESPFDFSKLSLMGEMFDLTNHQIKIAKGYDHNFVLSREKAKHDKLMLATILQEDRSGITLQVYTTEPGVQIYTANYLDGTISNWDGGYYPQYGGVTFETQHFANSPNIPSFPSTTITPDQPFKSVTQWRFFMD
ncbi:aldose epimerase family protein [Halosquirtibacter xylanolyticus]|uniref:aldose epimerase family protein n=1 Tax=Halosquirtibacter xylanolyticus TaxID=3374599 RepID=UPI00374A8187